MPRTKRMPPLEMQAKWKRDAERDARAMILMRQTGCSFQDAWLADAGSTAIPHSGDGALRKSGVSRH